MLTTTEIKRFIDDDAASKKKRLATIGQNYYEAKHDILKYSMVYFNADGKLVEDKVRSNIKISHPFFTELSDQLASYILSSKENPIRAKEKAEGLQDYLDLYFDEEFWAEVGDMIIGAYNKGFDYIYAYRNKENRLAFQYADSMGVVEVRAKDTDDACEYIIYWYIDRIEKGRKEIKRIQVWSDKETHYFVQIGSGKIQPDKTVEINPRPHIVYTDEKSGKKMGDSFGFIPFWRLDNNRKQISGLKPIKAMIDDYDLMMCGLSNNLVDFDTPLHVVKGFEGSDLNELQQNIKTKKIIGVDEAGDVDVKTVDIPYEARLAKAAENERNIYKFGMGMNTYGLKDTTATTNVVIKAAYEGLNIKATNLIRRLKAVLKDICKVVIDEINKAHETGFSISDIEFKFVPTTMTNEKENAETEKAKADTQQVKVNTILNVAETIGDEQVLKLICEQLDLDYEDIKSAVEKAQKDADLSAAQNALNNVVINEPIEE